MLDDCLEEALVLDSATLTAQMLPSEGDPTTRILEVVLEAHKSQFKDFFRASYEY